MMRHLTLLLLLLASIPGLLLQPAPGYGRETLLPLQGLPALFYQPHTADLRLDATWWRQTMRSLKEAGVTDLYLQWTRHGGIDFLRQPVTGGPPLVVLLLQLADRHALKLHFGLYADPDFFSRIKQSNGALEVYCNRLRARSLAQARQLLAAGRNHASFAGFYLYEEIDDLNWREQNRQKILKAHLNRTVTELAQLAPNIPVAVSTFFTGQMTPDDFGAMWRFLLDGTDLILLVQDGAGTGRLHPDERMLYLQALARALHARPWGVIVELFVQDTASHDFSAAGRTAPLNRNYLKEIRAITPLPPVGFSLRYLISMPR